MRSPGAHRSFGTFVTAAVSTGKEAAPIKGLYDPGDDQGSVRATSVQRWVAYDVDFKTGRMRWERELRSALPTSSRHLKNNYASETPVHYGVRMYVCFGSIGLAA